MRPSDLEKAAESLEREAERLRAKARAHEDAYARRLSREDYFALARRTRLMMDALQLDLDAAVRRVSFDTGAPKETILHYLQAEARADLRVARWLRNRHIVQEARRGATNGEIAARHGVSPRTVGEIIRRAYRDAARVSERLRMP